MTARTWGLTTAAGLGALSLTLAACGGGSGSGGGGGDEGTPKQGGTLKVSGSSAPDHIDPVSAYSTINTGFSRNWARTLFGNKASNTFDETIPIVADMAAEIPTKDNKGISEDGKTYTIKLRGGVQWNTNPARAVTAQDFVRGFKRQCNPKSPTGAPYYRTVIEGMEEYCKGYEKVDAGSASAMAAYQNGNEISGVTAKDDSTLEFKLKQPASDFLNLLSLPFTSAAPKEYDRYVPDSAEFRKNTVSNGPYQMTSYSDKQYVLQRNKAWKQETDPLRKQHVDQVQINLGQDSPDAVQQQLEQGTADLAWDQPVPTSALPRLQNDPQFKAYESPGINPYIVFNLQSPNNNKALANKKVREAIEYAIDKSAIVKIYGGEKIAQVINQAIPPDTVGYEQFDPYPTNGSAGDANKCKQLLQQAGVSNLTLKFPYRTNSNHPKVAQSIQENLRGCGITAQLAADTNGNFYGKTLVTPSEAKAGKWDIAAPGWGPDWYGNNGRSALQPLFDGRTYGINSPDYGGYNDPVVNTLMDKAMTAQTEDEAGKAWHEADKRIMADAPIVPMIVQKFTTYKSKRVKGAQFMPIAQSFDYSQIWLGS